MLVASSPIPWVGCASVTRQGMVPHPTAGGGPSLYSFASPLSVVFFLTAPPSRLNVVLGYRRGVDRGGGKSTDSSGDCTPPHRQPLCGVVGPL